VDGRRILSDTVDHFTLPSMPLHGDCVTPFKKLVRKRYENSSSCGIFRCNTFVHQQWMC